MFKKMFKKLYVYVLASMFIFTGCSDLLDVDSDSLIPGGTDMAESEIQANVLGIASLLQNVAYKVVLLNDLRSDMLMTTEDASSDLIEINMHAITSNNELTKPTEFYNIVENCNDFLNNIGEYDPDKYVMSEDMFKTHIADVIKIKVWAYFQIAKIYNKVYYTKTSYKLVSNVVDSLPVEYDLKGILPVLIADMNEIEVKDAFDWTLVDEAYRRFGSYFLNYDIIIGDLYLWNEQYQEAADCFNKLINNEKMDYRRFFVTNAYSNNSYSTIFNSGTLGGPEDEVIASTEFREVNNQPFILQDWFGRGSAEFYMLAPTAHSAIMFDSEQSSNPTVRGDLYRRNASMRSLNGVDWIVTKYANHKYRFPLYRAAELHLKYAEALANLGRVDVGLALLNEGVSEYWDGVSGSFKPELGIPFLPSFVNNVGIRDRVSLEPVELLTEIEIRDSVSISVADSLYRFEIALISENSREFAFEGKRFETLVRFARRMDNPRILAALVAYGYEEQGVGDEIFQKLLDPANWYVKY